ncbi:hypothetical protein GCM10029992_38030 [Glycomyces albus]
MPPADLNAEPHANPEQQLERLLDAIGDVTSGTDPDQAAADHGLATTTLLTAAETYHQAGRAALESATATETWLQTHLAFTDWAHADQTAAAELAPRLEELRTAGIAQRWWFIRKHPHWRIRVQAAHPHTRPELVERLEQLCTVMADASSVSAWRPTIYEPETLAFGGQAGMSLAHELFSTDSRSALEYLQHTSPPIGLRETSILLCTRLLRAAGLEWFEIGDVWNRVAQLRPLTDEIAPDRLETLAESIKQLLAIGTGANCGLFADDSPLRSYAEWADAFASTGTALRKLSENGQLQRGLRSILAYHVIFHWNRIGLNAQWQTCIAHAAAAAVLG